MHDKRYRDGYVASHTRQTLAQQMRRFRGDDSQATFAEMIGKRQTIVSRLENPSYSGWTLRTLFEVAQALNVAVFVRFVDFPTFLQYTDDLSDNALRPQPYDEEAIEALVEEEDRASKEGALKALFASEPKQAPGRSALPRMIFERDRDGATSPPPANDAVNPPEQNESGSIRKRLAEAAD
jgi:transcriptional regulator with XRE-family HTH domain